ncbi:MAG: chloride channel protein [Methanomicrobiales archaeon]
MTDETLPDRYISPKIWQIILIAVIAIAFTAIWLKTYESLNAVIWMNEYVKANRWTIPAGVILFSLLVGLCLKYLHAPDVIHGGFTDSMKGEGAHSDYKTFPGTLLSSFFSLFSGASVGPEGPVAFLIMEISAWTREKLKIINEAALGFDVAALASAYNGIIGSPLFTAVFATEFNVGNKDALKFLAWNLLAGIIGYLFFSLLGMQSFASLLAFPPIEKITLTYVIYAIILGVLGALIAVFMGLVMKGMGDAIQRAFKDRIMTRILFAGVIIAIIGYFIPELMFSGESSIHSVINDPARFGIAMLFFMALLKILLLALSFKSGYLGGPIFPTLFTCTMVGLGLSLMFPGIPVGILVMCLEVAVITLALGVPLTAILLIVVIGNVDPNTLALLVLSSVVALIMGIGVRELREKRAGKEGDVTQA